MRVIGRLTVFASAWVVLSLLIMVIGANAASTGECRREDRQQSSLRILRLRYIGCGVGAWRAASPYSLDPSFAAFTKDCAMAVGFVIAVPTTTA